MNAIERFFDFQRKHFEKGGKFEKFYPFFESIESVFFAPARKTLNPPNVRDSIDVKRFMMLVIVALLPHYAFGIYNVGFQSHLASGLDTGPTREGSAAVSLEGAKADPSSSPDFYSSSGARPTTGAAIVSRIPLM